MFLELTFLFWLKMHNFHIAPGVSVIGLKPVMWGASAVVAGVYDQHGLECWLSSGTSGRHGRGSLHFVGYGADYSLHNVPEGPHGENLAAKMAARIKKQLGEEFDVVYGDANHLDHIHVEFQPKKGVNQ